MAMKFNKACLTLCYITLTIICDQQRTTYAKHISADDKAARINSRFLNIHLLHNTTDYSDEQETACMTTCVDAYKHVTRPCCAHLNCTSLPVPELLKYIGSCSVDGLWLSWGHWSDCSNTVCQGSRVRQRDCYFAPHLQQGAFCHGHSREMEDCGSQSPC